MLARVEEPKFAMLILSCPAVLSKVVGRFKAERLHDTTGVFDSSRAAVSCFVYQPWIRRWFIYQQWSGALTQQRVT